MVSADLELRKSMAEDIKLGSIPRYLCDAGPGLCEKCPSRCAYGKRYINEYVPTFGKVGKKFKLDF